MQDHQVTEAQKIKNVYCTLKNVEDDKIPFHVFTTNKTTTIRTGDVAPWLNIS